MSNSTQTPSVNKQEWEQAADKAKAAAASVGEMASHATSAVGAMVSQAATDVGNKADELTASAGAGIQGLGDRIREQGPQSGPLGNATQAVARTVTDGGVYLEDNKLRGVTEDVAQMIRRKPISAILIAIGLGWAAARFLKR